MAWRITVSMRTLWPIFFLALAWSVGPALGPILDGQLIGHGMTDLYPSVWGLWAFAEGQPDLPGHTALLGHPDGMGFYYSSPIKGWIAWPLIPLIGLPATWNGLLIASRFATVACSYGAARAWGLGSSGSLAAAALYGASPFFHGYAVEGIAEGTDGWTLALWLWALGAKRFRLAALPFALTILSSWYLGMTACLLAALALVWNRKVAWSGLGLLIISPALFQFTAAFPGAGPLSPEIRQAMGASLTVPTPGWKDGLNPFAINAYIGFTAAAAALMSRTRWVLAAAIPALLSLGIGPIYELPIAELVRFPYRWHAATLVLLAPAVAITAERLRWGHFLGPIIVLEGLALSPVEPILPGADAELPAYTRHITGPVLELPGPVAMAPGEVNRSRRRAQYILYHQVAHGQPSPWVPDFNAVGVRAWTPTDAIAALQQMDPLVSPRDQPLQPILRDIPADHVVIQKRHMGPQRTQTASVALRQSGWDLTFDDDTVSIYSRPGSRSGSASKNAP